MWEDYYEPSEFEILMEGFKDSIRENVKEEIKVKIEQLEKENAELRDVKEKWEDIKRYYEEAMRDLKNEKERAKLIETIKKNITVGNFATSVDKNGRYCFKLFSKSNRLICVSDYYSSKAKCDGGINSVKRFAETANVIIEEAE